MPREPREIDEGPDQADLERFGADTAPCPKCGADIYDESPWCHKCGHVLGDGADGPRTPPWVFITVAATVAAIAVVLLF